MTDIELYNKAKEAYYNGTPIMTDYEFDELERKLGLENKSYIGAKHNPTYTVKHPYIMGSLSKVQIKRADDGTINWLPYFNEVFKYVCRNSEDPCLIVTPKFDGCSFETIVKEHSIVKISSRGDGDYGKDITQHLIRKFNSTHTSLGFSQYTLRGEVLIDKTVFTEKYAEYVNPRSFVSGLLNRDYDANDEEFQSMLDDLSIVIYDTRYVSQDGGWVDADWDNFIGMDNLPTFYKHVEHFTLQTFIDLYEEFAEYREKCQFALDGIVFKPTTEYRVLNLVDVRPKDCVAVKFIPMLEETEVVDIEWNVGKTGELCPVIIVNPVVMDGKKITRASAHNYGYLIDNKVSVGTKVILSLAGDIIPFIYKITNTDNFNKENLCLPDIDVRVDGCHLYHVMTVEEENRLKFVSSAQSLNIPSIGPAAAETIYDYMVEQCKGDEFFGIPAKETPNNILLVMGGDINRALGGKSGLNAQKAFDEYVKNLSIKDIIVSCTFTACGVKVAEQIEKQMIYGNGDFEHLAEKAYSWVFNENSPEMLQVKKIMKFTGKSAEDFKLIADESVENAANQIPVILTGEPNNYDSKGDFLKKHPEYRMTGSWKEVQIVFTNDMESRTGKMKKALEKGIRIELY